MSTSYNSDQTVDMNSGATKPNNQVSPLSNIIYFILLTLIYCAVTIAYLYTGKNLESLKENSNNKIFLLIYIAFLLAGNYYLNLRTASSLCPNTDASTLYSQILLITIAPWLIIFVILFFLLELFNGWIRPFSNTIGYVIIGFLGSKKIITKLLNKKETDERKKNDLKNVFKYIENHNEKFINEFSTDLVNFESFIEQLKEDNIFNISEANLKTDLNIIELYKLLSIKNIIGRIVWYILAGLLICSITYNYIINIKCSGSVESNKKDIDKLYTS